MTLLNSYKNAQKNSLWCSLQRELPIATRDEMSSHMMDAPDRCAAGSLLRYDDPKHASCAVVEESYFRG